MLTAVCAAGVALALASPRLSAQGRADSTASADTTHSDTLHYSFDDLLDSIGTSHPVIREGDHATLAAHARANVLHRVLENPVFEVQHATKTTWQIYTLEPIPWPWQLKAKRRLGTAQVDVAHAEADLLADSVGYEAAQRFVDALQSRQELALASEGESLAQVAVDQAAAGRQLGQVGDLTVLQAQVSLDAARRDRVSAEQANRLAVQGIAIMLGYPPDTMLVLDGDLATVAALPESVPADSGWLVQATNSDPELERLNAVSVQAQREAQLWHSLARWPEIDIGPSYGFLTTGALHALSYNFNFTLPLWHGHEAEIEAANEDRAAAEAGHEAREQGLTSAVLDATTTLDNTQRQLDSLRLGDLVRATRAESLAATALRQGGPYLTIWLTARQAYLDVQRAVLDLEWRAARARLTLRYLTGNLYMQLNQQKEGAQ